MLGRIFAWIILVITATPTLAEPASARFTWDGKNKLIAQHQGRSTNGITSAPLPPPIIVPSDKYVLAGRVLGRIASSKEICELLNHAFFSHDPTDYPNLNWDNSNQSSPWLRENVVNLRATDSKQDNDTKNEVNENLVFCLQSLAEENPRRLSVVEGFLPLPAPQDNSAPCYSTAPAKVNSSGPPTGRTQSQVGQQCINWNMPSKMELFFFMLTIREAHPTLRSILDSAEGEFADYARRKLAIQAKGEEYAQKNETAWRLAVLKDELTDQMITTASSIQTNRKGAVAQLKLRCDKGKVRVTALIVDESGRPTVTFAAQELFFGRNVAIGQIRINDEQPSKTPFFQEAGFWNQIDSGLDSKLLLSGQYWRILIGLETSEGPLVIKIPVFQPEIQQALKACR